MARPDYRRAVRNILIGVATAPVFEQLSTPRLNREASRAARKEARVAAEERQRALAASKLQALVRGRKDREVVKRGRDHALRAIDEVLAQIFTRQAGDKKIAKVEGVAAKKVGNDKGNDESLKIIQERLIHASSHETIDDILTEIFLRASNDNLVQK